MARSSRLSVCLATVMRNAVHRQHRRAGQAVARVLYDADVVAMLVRLHWLLPREAFTADEIASAIQRLLADAARTS